MTKLILPALMAMTLGCEVTSGSKSTPASAAKTTIELVDVTYDGLDQAVAREKGKVVAIDVWATFCAPCVKKFPSFVDLHETHAAKGLVCISVSTDDLEARSKATEFLKEKNATFANYRLSESNEKITKDLNAKYPTDMQPVMLIFNRKGEKVKEFGGKDKPEEIEAFLVKLLGEQ